MSTTTTQPAAVHAQGHNDDYVPRTEPANQGNLQEQETVPQTEEQVLQETTQTETPSNIARAMRARNREARRNTPGQPTFHVNRRRVVNEQRAIQPETDQLTSQEQAFRDAERTMAARHAILAQNGTLNEDQADDEYSD